MFFIGEAAKRVRMPIKTIRYYHDIGLVQASDLSDTGYRLYTEKDIRKLVFTRHVRAYGFSLETCRELLELYENPDRSSKEVKDIASRKLVEIREKMDGLQRLYDELSLLERACHGDERPDCPILDFFGGQADDSSKP